MFFGRALALVLSANLLFVAPNITLADTVDDDVRVLRVGVPFNPPIAIPGEGEGQRPSGLVVDIIEDVAQREGWHIEYVYGPLSKLMKRLGSGNVDILSSIAYTAARAKKFNLSKETVVSNWAVIYRRRGVSIESIVDLAGKKVALIPRNVHTTALRKLLNAFNLNVVEVPARDYKEVLALVGSGKADVGVISRTFHLIHGAKGQAIPTNIVFNPVRLKYAARKGQEQDILDRIDATLREQKPDPNSAYNRSLQHWLTQPAARSAVPTWAYMSGAGILALALMAWSINIWLRVLVRRKTVDLRESEEKFRQLAENIDEAFWIGSPDLKKVHYISPGYRTIWGREPEELYETPLAWKNYIHPNDREKVMAYLHAIAAGKLNGGTFPEFRVIRPNGETRVVRTRIYPIYDDHGNTVRVAGVTEDITNQKNIEAQLLQAQKMEVVGQLAGGIAHDFNNILGIAIGNLDLAEDCIPKDSLAGDRLKKVQHALMRGADLTKRMLAFSRKSPNLTSPVSVNAIIEKITGLIARSLTPEISTKFHLGDDLWLVDVDDGEFEDALINLALNARDAMDGSGALVIETKNKVIGPAYKEKHANAACGNYVCVTVSDTGQGMGKEILEKIFEPFFTTKAKNKGTGLGMSMVYSFVKHSKGFIEVTSEPDQGTTFHIFLPRSASASSKTDLAEHVNERFEGGSETILVVDDEPELAEIATTTLTQLGYQALTAYGADEALAYLETDAPIDLLFTDIVIPGGINGLKLAKMARTLRPDIKIQLTSGFTERIETERIEDAEVYEKFIKTVLHKPYRRGELAKAVRAALDPPLL